MLTYQQVMDANLPALTTAAKEWDNAAKKFDSAKTTYDAQVKSVTTDGFWTGEANLFAQPQTNVSSQQLQAAAHEARAIASLLRDAHTQLTELVKKVKAAVADAQDANMKVNEYGVCSWNGDPGARNDPELPGIVAKWTAHIDDAVRAVDDADQGVKLALTAAVKSPDPTLPHGFNGKAVDDIEKVEAQRASDLKTKLDNGKLTPEELAEMQRLFRDNKGDQAFTQTFLTSVGPQGTLEFNKHLRDLMGDDKNNKDAYQYLRDSLATTLATATQDTKSPFYDTWRKGLREAGVKNFADKGDQTALRGYQLLVDLMGQGKGYNKQFLSDLGDDMIAAEKKKDDLWLKWGNGHPDYVQDPVDGLLAIMSKQPDAATYFLDAGADGKANDHLRYLLNDRKWPKEFTTTPYGMYESGKPLYDFFGRAGLGAAMEAAATGEIPGTKHEVGGHTEAQARVMRDTINVLNEQKHPDKLHAQLRGPLGNMLADYTADTHHILARDFTDYNKWNNTNGQVWTDENGTHMAVDKFKLAKIMRGVADDPAAFATMYGAERQYAANVMGITDFNNKEARAAVIGEASSALGFYDGVRADVILDKRDAAVQWATDVRHHVTTSSGVLLNFIPGEVAPGVDMPKGVKVGADVLNRLVDFAMYDWANGQIAEAKYEGGEDNAKTFLSGQKEVDLMATEWAKKNGVSESDDYALRNLLQAAHGEHIDARDEVFVAVRRE
ncbi:hypothetical protein [Streptomyces palmae]|uniref:Uncharacterized protein n=1 Tax=Streptomyces palmae TaxID=1701085 RepID=A0A4Z0HHD0_9ACTN|nr:hypothetical protein [Streptomyces palmae]TGB17584.1 hypothetical protein E4099_03260 [Streptomyces palmae]